MARRRGGADTGDVDPRPFPLHGHGLRAVSRWSASSCCEARILSKVRSSCPSPTSLSSRCSCSVSERCLSSVFPLPFRYHSVTIPLPFRYHSTTIPTQLLCHLVAIDLPFLYHYVIITFPVLCHSVTSPFQVGDGRKGASACMRMVALAYGRLRCSRRPVAPPLSRELHSHCC